MTSTRPDVTPERLDAWRRLARAHRDRPGEPLARADESRRVQAQSDRLVRGVLRERMLLDALLERPGAFRLERTEEPLHWVMRIAAYEKIHQSSIPDYAIGEQGVALARRVVGERATGFVNAVLRRVLPTLPDSPDALSTDPFVTALPPHVRWSVPEPIFKRLARGWGKAAFAEVLPALAAGEAPVWLRVNTLRTAPEAAMAALAGEGVATQAPVAAMPEALLWTGGGDLLPWQTAAWQRGELTVQDFGAMLAARLLAPRPGQRVLDACAAPGGKTGHLWQAMQGQGQLVALEPDASRRQLMLDALARLFGADAGIEVPPPAGLTDFAPDRQFDRVLLDVPCLALGLIGRHPEIRWDDRLRRLAAQTAEQCDLLAAGAARVAPGGRLLWMTCSPTRQENEGILGPWLERNPAWRMVAPEPLLGPDLFGLVETREGWIRTRPDRVRCDGFALALIERRATSAC